MIEWIHDARDTVRELFSRRKQTHDKKRFVRKVEKVTRMNEHMIFAEQIHDQIFLRLDRWYAQHAVPATLRVQQFARRHLSRSSVQRPVILANTRLNLLTDSSAALEQPGGSQLDRRRHGKIG